MRRTIIIFFLAACASLATVAGGQSIQPSRPPLDSLEAFMDSVIRVEIEEYGVPGIVVTVVRDGQVVLSKGYGVADRGTGRPVSPDSTVFRVGSISKPITALAVLQLAEAGRIDLDAPVSRYVGGLLTGPYADRVTVRHLVTHSGGLDVRLNGTMARTVREQADLLGYLRRDLPPAVHRPGEMVRYSNHGYTLLGRVIEAASGEPFEQYMERHVFRPAGMGSSAYRLEGDLARRAAVGYERVPGAVAAPVLHPRIVPAAALNTTGGDMGRLMIAILDSGHVAGGGALYSPATGALVLGRQFEQHPAVPGLTFGFFETMRRGARAVGHSGGVSGFMSGMYLWPEERTGLFISDNGADGDVVQVVYAAFVDRFLSRGETGPPVQAPGAQARARRVAGEYRLANVPIRNLERAGALRRGDLRIGARRDGDIIAFQVRFVETAPGVYHAARGDEVLAFRTDARGRPSVLFTTDPFGGNLAWVRVPWYRSATLHQILASLCLVGFLIVPWLRPRSGTRSRRGFVHVESASPPVRVARVHRRAVAAGYLVFVVGLVLVFRGIRDTGLTPGIPPSLKIVLALGIAATLAAAALPWTGWRLRRAGVPNTELALHAATALLAVLFALLLWEWNLLGFRFG